MSYSMVWVWNVLVLMCREGVPFNSNGPKGVKNREKETALATKSIPCKSVLRIWLRALDGFKSGSCTLGFNNHESTGEIRISTTAYRRVSQGRSEPENVNGGWGTHTPCFCDMWASLNKKQL